MIKLHLGSGGSCYGVVVGIDGPQVGGSVYDWINIDARHDTEIWSRHGATDIVHGYPRMLEADFKHLPFSDNFADFAYSHHSLEHVRMDEVIPTLDEWRRVLKNGAVLLLNVPDLEWIAQQIITQKGNLLWSINGEKTGNWEAGYTKLDVCIFGDQSNNNTQLHKCGFTEHSLRRQLNKVGFRNIQINHLEDMGMVCLEARAEK